MKTQEMGVVGWGGGIGTVDQGTNKPNLIFHTHTHTPPPLKNKKPPAKTYLSKL